MMGMDMGGFGWLGMGLMWLWLLVPIGLVVGIGWLFARAADRRNGQLRGDDAAATLRRRLAAGEIDVEQYEEVWAALGLSGERMEGGSSD